ncbi:MAG: sex pilus assembly protein [Gammaproteobacteria bacterium]|nr:MAG: sex pilus assembly protein [Gammaproteobacteria bacterium]
MKLKELSATWDRTRIANTFLLVSNLVLASAMAVTGVLGWTRHERLVLVPPHLQDKAKVAYDAASAEYFKAWGLFVATLIGNITPENVDFVADAVSPLFSSRIYPAVRTQILSLAKDPVFGKAAAVNYFAPRQVVYEPATSRVFVVGDMVVSTFEKVGEIEHVVYEMKFSMQAGLPVIEAFDSYPGTQPHTLKWQASQSKP